MVQLTLPLSELPSQKRRAGSLRAKEAVKDTLRQALRQCGLSRETVADELSRLTGDKIGVHTVNNWAAPEKTDRPVPLEYAAALAVVTGDAGVIRAAVEAAGLVVLTAEEAPLYELGKLTAEDRQRAALKKALFERIGSK
jgi:hypothetical protein